MKRTHHRNERKYKRDVKKSHESSLHWRKNPWKSQTSKKRKKKLIDEHSLKVKETIRRNK
jgi:hypothetical protein